MRKSPVDGRASAGMFLRKREIGTMQSISEKPLRLISPEPNGAEPPPPAPGKRVLHRHLIEADQEWLHGLTQKRFIGNGAPRWWCLSTPWMWTLPYSELTPTELNVLVTLHGGHLRLPVGQFRPTNT